MSTPAYIGTKLVAPPIPAEAISRPRVESLIRALIDRHRLVLIVATAGAGKTTATAGAVGQLGDPVAWLSVDDTDVAPGRLVTYLDAAVGRVCPELAGLAVNAMSANALPHAETAGLLSSSIGDRPLVLVLDQLERLQDNAEAWAVLESFVRHAGPGVRLVLLSREFVPAGRLDTVGPEVGFLGESSLAFTEEEAAAALVRRGVRDVDPRHAVAETGGWVTGVLFEAWRSAEHLTGIGGEADPLYGYLSAHILDRLDPADRGFLIDTALLDEVTPQRAAALGADDAVARLASLRRHTLPAVWAATHTLRCHPRFREYLTELLARRPGATVRDRRVRYGQLLASEGRDEEATEVLLETGALEHALAPAARAVISLVERLDFRDAQRWLDILGPVAAEHDPLALSLGHLMLSVAQEEFGRGAAYADDLAARGLRDEFARSSGRAVILMALCYADALDVDALRAVVAAAAPGASRGVAEYITAAFTHEPPDTYALPPLSLVAEYPSLLVGKYFHGRVTELDGTPDGAWTEWEPVGIRILAARSLGRTAEALEYYERASGWGAQSLLIREVAPDLLLDAGRREEAQAALDTYDEVMHRKSSLFGRLGSLTMRAKMALRLDADHAAALQVLAVFDRLKPPTGAGPLEERAATWRGLALLLAGADVEAVELLRKATKTMLAADLVLELPAAAVFLAEAEWRAGNPEAADRAADTALTAAYEQGSTFLMLEALGFFPAVVSRRIDAEASAYSAWHDLGRALHAPRKADRSGSATSSVVLREFGSVELLVDGVAVSTRIRKSLELLAYLLAHGGRARRRQVMEALFGASDRSAQAYLRQARSRLNRALPELAAISTDGDDLTLADALAVTSESVVIERRLRHARHLTGEVQRLRAIVSVLETAEAGEFLPGVRGAWAEDRREHIRTLLIEAEFEAAQLALAVELYPEARTHAERVLREQPYHESAWQTLIRVAGLLGDSDGVLDAYHACERALRELGTSPSPTTRRLLENLRR
ncbi:BTAD domain-containing putative transcriptional regulator [Nocardia sp. NPDC050378]|uniref:BTAD domain-containing putative transcriptional regulator n=1 Tax=Nocardia sp. NPDC050378 TaxID=3155400 RepID=UPI0033C2FD9E